MKTCLSFDLWYKICRDIKHHTFLFFLSTKRKLSSKIDTLHLCRMSELPFLFFNLFIFTKEKFDRIRPLDIKISMGQSQLAIVSSRMLALSVHHVVQHELLDFVASIYLIVSNYWIVDQSVSRLKKQQFTNY